LWQFVRRRRTFGESNALRRSIKRNFTREEFFKIRAEKSDVVVTVSNLSMNTVEYKSINDCTYEEFCHWIWISCNYIPFMSIAKVNGFEYADGGLGRSEEHTSELQSRENLVCRLLLEKKKPST